MTTLDATLTYAPPRPRHPDDCPSCGTRADRYTDRGLDWLDCPACQRQVPPARPGT